MAILEKIKIISFKAWLIIKYFLSAGFVLFFIFFTASFAQATIDIKDDHSCSTPYGTITRDYVYVDYLFPDAPYDISGIKLLIQGSTVPAGSYVNICDKDFTDPYISNHDCAGGYQFSTSSCVVDTLNYGGSGSVLIDCSFSSPLTVNTGRYIIETVGMTPYYCSYGGTPSGLLAVNADGGGVYGASGWRIGYLIYYQAPILDYSLTPIHPLSSEQFVSATSTVDFSFSYTKPNGDYNLIDYYVSGVDTNGDPDGMTYHVITNIGTSTSGTINDQLELPDGLYAWFSFFYTQSYPHTMIATSSLEFFAVKAQEKIIDTCGGIQTTTGITDIHLFGDLLCGLKMFTIWGFTPSQTSLNSIGNSFDDIKATFPFTAFFQLTDAVIAGVGTSTPNMAGTLSIPFINHSGDYIMLPVLASSSLPNLIGQTNATLFRNSLKWILWALAAFMVFITFKKI